MTFPIEVIPAHARIEAISEAVRDAPEQLTFYHYQNAPRRLPVIRVPIGLPIYRMANFRTRSAQLAFLRQHPELAADYFEGGQENVDAQREQHNFLVRFAEEGRRGSITPIMEVLQRDPQTEPLLVSSSGIVVNGNRRLAAMRELFADDRELYREFSHVNCMVLPASATSREIREIEVRLQMTPQTKLPYEWVNESLAIRELQGDQMTVAEIAQLMQKRPRDVENAIGALTEAEIYLRDWLGSPRDYERVEASEQLFADLAKALRDKSGVEQEAARRVGFLLADRASALGRRVYDYNFSFGRDTRHVLERLAERLDVDLTSEPTPLAEDPEAEPLDIDFGAQVETGSTLQPLVQLLDDPQRRDEIRNELIRVCDVILDERRNVEAGLIALTTIRDVHTKLAEVDLTNASPSTHATIEAQLHAISERVERLQRTLAELRSNG